MTGKPFSWSLWGWPIALAVISAVGLLSALLDDGVWDWVSWAALGLPVVVGCWHAFKRGR